MITNAMSIMVKKNAHIFLFKTDVSKVLPVKFAAAYKTKPPTIKYRLCIAVIFIWKAINTKNNVNIIEMPVKMFAG